MNEFLTSYLGGIIPVAFRIQSGEESMIVGRDRPEFTITLNEDLDKKELLTSTSLAAWGGLYEGRTGSRQGLI